MTGCESMYLIDMFYFVAQKLPAAYAPVMPATLDKPLDLRFVLEVQGAFLGMALDGAQEVPTEVAAAVRDIHHRAITEFDSTYARGIVGGFNRISRHIDMGMYDAAYIMGTQSRLTHRLADDLCKGAFLAEHRIRSVQAAFQSMGMEFSGEHKDRVVDALYDRFDTDIRIGRNDLSGEIEKIGEITERLDHCIKHPQNDLRMI